MKTPPTIRTLFATACLAALAGHSAHAAGTTNPQVRFQTSMGSFVVELYPQAAPRTVANFLQYVKDKHYNGTVFHRVIKNFMVQGGGYDAKLVERRIRAPIVHEGRAAYQAGLRNQVGTLAMARTSEPNSASAQFFINTKNNAFLDPTPIPAGDPVPSFTYQGQTFTNMPRAALEGIPQLAGYTVFGKVIEGMPVVMQMQSVATHAQAPMASDVPVTHIVIQSATQLK